MQALRGLITMQTVKFTLYIRTYMYVVTCMYDTCLLLPYINMYVLHTEEMISCVYFRYKQTLLSLHIHRDAH